MHDGLDVVVARAHPGAIHLDVVLVVDAEHDQWMIRGWAVRDNVNQIGPTDGRVGSGEFNPVIAGVVDGPVGVMAAAFDVPEVGADGLAALPSTIRTEHAHAIGREEIGELVNPVAVHQVAVQQPHLADFLDLK